MNTEIAKILRWPVLLIILVVIFAELVGTIPRWAMGLALVPLGLFFVYLWQLASRKQ